MQLGHRRYLLAKVILPVLFGATFAASAAGSSRQAVIEGRLSYLKAKKAELEACAPQPPDLDRAARVVLPGAQKPAEYEAPVDESVRSAPGTDDMSPPEVEAAVDYSSSIESSGELGQEEQESSAELEDIDLLTPAGELALVMRVRADRAARAAVTRRFSSRAEREVQKLAREVCVCLPEEIIFTVIKYF